MAEQSFRQVFGTETEWPISVRTSDKRSVFAQLAISDRYHEFLVDNLPEGVVGTASQHGNTYNNLLSNGSRFYADAGGRFEYATPEDISVESLALSELAGEWIMAEALRKHIARDNDVQEGFMCKRVDGAGQQTWGYHINVGEDRGWLANKSILQIVTRPLLTHMAAGLPMFGGGAVTQDGSEYQYSFGQKVLNPILHDYDMNTTCETAKPMINLRDEPHADKEKYWRLHIVGVDPHISQWAAKMQIGSMSLVLLACREGLMDNLVFDGGLDSAARAMRSIAMDMTLKNKYRLVGSKKSHTVFDVEERIIKAVDKTKERTAEQDALLEDWKKSFASFKSDPDGFTKSDAMLKRKLVYEDLARRKKTKLDAGSRLLDILYTAPLWAIEEDARKYSTDELLAKSFAGRVRSKYFAEDMPSAINLSDRIKNPPKTTRAYRRGKEILHFKAKWHSWDSYSVRENERVVPRAVPDPFSGAIEDTYYPADDPRESF